MPLLRYRRYRPSHAAVMVPAPSASTLTWNPSDVNSNITLSGGNLIATRNSSFDGNFYGVRATGSGRTSGKFYFEATVGAAAVNNNQLCIAVSTISLSANPTSGTDTACWNNSGNVNGAGGGSAINSYVANDVLGVAVDLSAKLFWGRVNAGNWNNNGSANPATGAGGIDISSITAGTYYPAAWQFVENAAFTANFGATAYANAAPSGFGNW